MKQVMWSRSTSSGLSDVLDDASTLEYLPGFSTVPDDASTVVYLPGLSTVPDDASIVVHLVDVVCARS